MGLFPAVLSLLHEVTVLCCLAVCLGQWCRQEEGPS